MRKVLAAVAGIALALSVAGCPKSQCSDGSSKVTHGSNGTRMYYCHNGEWVKNR
jgi:hypothetical protein